MTGSERFGGTGVTSLDDLWSSEAFKSVFKAETDKPNGGKAPIKVYAPSGFDISDFSFCLFVPFRGITTPNMSDVGLFVAPILGIDFSGIESEEKEITAPLVPTGDNGYFYEMRAGTDGEGQYLLVSADSQGSFRGFFYFVR